MNSSLPIYHTWFSMSECLLTSTPPLKWVEQGISSRSGFQASLLGPFIVCVWLDYAFGSAGGLCWQLVRSDTSVGSCLASAQSRETRLIHLEHVLVPFSASTQWGEISPWLWNFGGYTFAVIHLFFSKNSVLMIFVLPHKIPLNSTREWLCLAMKT